MKISKEKQKPFYKTIKIFIKIYNGEEILVPLKTEFLKKRKF